MKNGSSKRRVLIHWFRRDLRLEDNRALAFALREAAKLKAEVLPLFIFDQMILKRLEDKDDARVTFIHKTILGMETKLLERGSGLRCEIGDPLKIWSGLLQCGLEIVGVSFNHDYEPAARVRDQALADLLAKRSIPLWTFKDQVIFEKDEVAKDDGKPYTVFTPFAKKWKIRLQEKIAQGERPLESHSCSPQYDHLISAPTASEIRSIPKLNELGFKENTAIEFPPIKVEVELLKKYGARRDLPAVKGTSHLGLHLRFGTVSIRKLVAKARELDAETWLGELIWREFFMQILWHFPHVAEGAFRPEYDQIVWRNDESEFLAWCEGRTGYPMVDAGMRELNTTGFMHNRVRMVAGSFLVKHLLIDWRWGEAYFARRLLDFELSANNGNWQWVAGSGCDAAPYFRVFNPELQLKRFDPKHEYVRKWVPEFGTDKYPAPIVDHQEARARVLRAYAVVKAKPDS